MPLPSPLQGLLHLYPLKPSDCPVAEPFRSGSILYLLLLFKKRHDLPSRKDILWTDIVSDLLALWRSHDYAAEGLDPRRINLSAPLLKAYHYYCVLPTEENCLKVMAASAKVPKK
jgi:hypothetical protein